MNRLLSLDGGGIRGVFTIEVLKRVEAMLRERYQNDTLVLADYFNFIGGTSTGAIIAALLAWGKSVSEVSQLYEEFGKLAFQPRRVWRAFRSKYHGLPVSRKLLELFQESDGTPSILGSERLRTFLLILLRNASTGSTWPVTNNPHAKFNRRADGSHSNLDLPLWQLVRASTAAPTFFPSEIVTLVASDGVEQKFEFVDGGVSPHLNPSVIMYLQATLPKYEMNLAVGRDNLYILSVGTGSSIPVYAPGEMTRINRVGGAIRVLRALMSAVNEQQDVMCRVLGHCVYGPPINRELGDLIPEVGVASADARFLYCRYNYSFTDEDRHRARAEFGSRDPLAIDDLRSIPLLRELGALYASDHVKAEHLPNAPLLQQRLMKF